jgi:hypothetical protein
VLRDRIARGFSLVEDVVYVGLGLLLAGAALVLLGSLGVFFGRGLMMLRKRAPGAVAERA